MDLYEFNNSIKNVKVLQLLYGSEEYNIPNTEKKPNFPKAFNVIDCSTNDYRYDHDNSKVSFKLNKENTGFSSLIDSDIQFIMGNSDKHTITLGCNKHRNITDDISSQSIQDHYDAVSTAEVEGVSSATNPYDWN